MCDLHLSHIPAQEHGIYHLAEKIQFIQIKTFQRGLEKINLSDEKRINFYKAAIWGAFFVRFSMFLEILCPWQVAK